MSESMAKKPKSIEDRFFESWPVMDVTEFEGVVIDATKWNTGEYTAMFNFYRSVDEQIGEHTQNTGMSLCTQIDGHSLRELYLKIETLLTVGLFDGTEVSDHGRLFNENGDELAQICWHQFSDEEWDETSDDDMSGLTITFESEFPPPTMIQ